MVAHPEVTAPKKNLSAQVADLRRQVVQLAKLQDRSIAGFCMRQSISKAHFYNLQKKKKGPRVAYAGNRRIITPEAEHDWELEREAEAAEAIAQKSG